MMQRAALTAARLEPCWQILPSLLGGFEAGAVFPLCDLFLHSACSSLFLTDFFLPSVFPPAVLPPAEAPRGLRTPSPDTEGFVLCCHPPQVAAATGGAFVSPSPRKSKQRKHSRARTGLNPQWGFTQGRTEGPERRDLRRRTQILFISRGSAAAQRARPQDVPTHAGTRRPGCHVLPFLLHPQKSLVKPRETRAAPRCLGRLAAPAGSKPRRVGGRSTATPQKGQKCSSGPEEGFFGGRGRDGIPPGGTRDTGPNVPDVLVAPGSQRLKSRIFLLVPTPPRADFVLPCPAGPAHPLAQCRRYRGVVGCGERGAQQDTVLTDPVRNSWRSQVAVSGSRKQSVATCCFPRRSGAAAPVRQRGARPQRWHSVARSELNSPIRDFLTGQEWKSPYQLSPFPTEPVLPSLPSKSCIFLCPGAFVPSEQAANASPRSCPASDSHTCAQGSNPFRGKPPGRLTVATQELLPSLRFEEDIRT
nr:uncharacterized protein LOC125183249 [Anser cygnoides]